MKHLQTHGFQVETKDIPQEQLTALSQQAGVSQELSSCHTGKIGNYAIEGHVPADDIKKLLKEKPAVAGIAVPGMPMGSPGMEQGGRKQPFDTIAFTKDGKKTVFASHK
ncbi:MAG TPA: DUF411 domain-containing protein [Vicinamibacterales bacterium]